MAKNLEQLIFKEGLELLKKSQGQDSAFLKKNWWYKKMLTWVMSDKKFKTNLFRFIDVLPSLSSEKLFLSHFNEYFKSHRLGLSGLGQLAPSLLAKSVRAQIRKVAQMFITGSNTQEALKTLSKNWEEGLAFSMDILGEATLSEKEAENYYNQYLCLMDSLVLAQKGWPKKERLQTDAFGPIPTVNLSIKASSLFSQIKTEAWEYSKSQLKNRLRPIFQKAVKNFVFINLDMEQYHYKDLFMEIFKDLLMEEELRAYPHFGIVCQAYLKDSFKDLQELSRFAEKRKERITIRLVKGAYWDSEVLLARQKNWPIPVYTKKEETDANFEKCVQWLFENPAKIKIAIGSHNIRSMACALAWHKLKPKTQLEFQMLDGMGEDVAKSLREQGYCVRIYCAMGEMIPGMSYLARRLLENSSNQSFILNSFVKNKSPKELLASPKSLLKNRRADNIKDNKITTAMLQPKSLLKNRRADNSPLKQTSTLPASSVIPSGSASPSGSAYSSASASSVDSPFDSVISESVPPEKSLPSPESRERGTQAISHKIIFPQKTGAGILSKIPLSQTGTFSNHPLLDFSQKQNRENFKFALEDWKKRFPVEVPLIIEGKEHKSSKVFTRKNPSQTNQIISRSFLSEKSQAERAVQQTSSFFETWRYSSPQTRILNLRKLAHLLQKKEMELSALQVFEVGKTWGEAQADVAEAIDFCHYYASSYEQMIQPKQTAQISGEESFSHFEAIGPAVVIAPWNFPLAILTGMTVAPLLCGNTVLIKPAEQSALTAYQLAKLLQESGWPKQSFAFLPGEGEEIGAYLAQHPKISIISFTGSFKVGSQIIKNAGEIKENQKDIKKCVVEMGGKNAVIIDSSADLDEAVQGALISSFKYQGQKCSASSRIIVLEDVYEKFMERFLPALESLIIGPPENPSSSLGPLVDEDAFKRIQSFIQREKSAKLFEGHSQWTKQGWFCPPLVYLRDREDSDLWQKELFAPLLAVSKAKNLDSAIKQTNKTCFGLTAGFYSRHPGHIEKFKSLVEAGNLYVNRNCTGALVERHPFGGRKMSGLGSKTGEPEYLKQFVHTKIVTENSMRRGFAPELFDEDFL